MKFFLIIFFFITCITESFAQDQSEQKPEPQKELVASTLTRESKAIIVPNDTNEKILNLKWLHSPSIKLAKK